MAVLLMNQTVFLFLGYRWEKEAITWGTAATLPPALGWSDKVRCQVQLSLSGERSVSNVWGVELE